MSHYLCLSRCSGFRKLAISRKFLVPRNSLSVDVKSFKGSGDFKQGDKLHGFIIKEVTPVKEMHLTAIRLIHKATGAQYIHLSRDDSNNVFSVGFRTTPKDSTGLPHILEHMSLCGSKKFPVRDPFFKMLRRSLATFMNAMTAPDYTFYPFSTQNPQDFKNLQSIYLDCVFNPLLRKLDFQQEGWRLEHTNVNDRNSDIIFKGVVFNEMKGVFSNNYNLFSIRLLNEILPDHTYGVISGGDPSIIPTLKYEDLIKFHACHYHPSNSCFYSYGNFPLEDHLQFINENYLQKFNKIDVSSTKVPSQNRWTSPKKRHISCRLDPMIADANRQNLIAIASLCNDITDIQKTFDVYVLSQLLLDGPNSAFYKSFIDTNIGTGFGPMTGYESQCRDTVFIVSLQGVQKRDFKEVEKIYNDTILKVIQDGFNKTHIQSILHGIELSVKHQTENYGLNLLFNLLPLWNHDGNITNSLKINDAINNFKQNIELNPRYLQSLVEEYLLKNNHKLVMTMSSEPEYENKLFAAERVLLDSKLAKFNPKEINEIFENGQTLLKEMEKEEDLSVLPTLKMENLKEDVDRYKFNDIKISGVPIQISEQPTNGICYYRGIINTKQLPDELKKLLPIFNYIVVKMGTDKYNYRQWDQNIQLKTGGLFFSNHIAEYKNGSYEFEEGIMISSYCLDKNAKNMWQLWEELFNRVKMTDLKRFETLVKINAADAASCIADTGHLYAMSSAASLVSPVGKIKESLSGLEYVNRMKEIVQLKDLSNVLEQIQLIGNLLLNKMHLRSIINLSEKNKEEILSGLHEFYSLLKGDNEEKGILLTKCNSFEIAENCIHHVLPYDVNYTSKAVLTVPYSHSDYAPLQVLTKLLTSLYLHPQIREKGGAYGSGAKLTIDGTLLFYSYRDPNSTKTFDLFDGSWEFINNYRINHSEIVEAKLSLFQSIDAPVAPGNRGLLRFCYGLTDDDIQRYREQLKAVTIDDIMNVTNKYLNPTLKNRNVGRALLGPQNLDLVSRNSENWNIFDHAQRSQYQSV